MRRCILDFALLTGAVLGSASAATAQYSSVFNPTPVANPYVSPPSRNTLSPWLNLTSGQGAAGYLGVLSEFDRRAQQVNVNSAILDFSVTGNRLPFTPYLDDRNDEEVPFRQLPPTGHSAGFMIYNAYYRIPNTRGYLPYNPQMGYGGAGQMQQQVPQQR